MSTSHTILIISRDQAFSRGVAKLFSERGFQVEKAATAGDAIFLLEKKLYQLVLFEEGLEGISGLELLDRLREQSLFTPLIVVAGPETLRNAPDKLKKGAFDLREKPDRPSQLLPAVDSALHEATLLHAVQYLRHEQHYIYDMEAIPAANPAMREFMTSLREASRHGDPVILTGEPGCGKGFFAGVLHANSSRREGPLVSVNCAAIPENVLEDELFGYSRDSRPGRERARSGRCQQAHGGSFCLEIVEALPLAIQDRLAGMVKNGYFTRPEEDRQIPVDLRFLATSELPAGDTAAIGSELADIFGRNILEVPPLRRRLEDLPSLAESFLNSSAAHLNRTAPKITPDFIKALEKHPWPGNLRELKNLMGLCAMSGYEGELDRESALKLLGQANSPEGEVPDEQRFMADTLNLKDLERRAIISALEECDWVQKEAAAELGVTERTMTYKLNKLGIRHPRFRARHRRSKTPKLKSN